MERVKRRVYEIIADAPEGDKIGRVVNFLILLLIALNVMVGLFETVKSLEKSYPNFFYYFEFVSVMIFTVEFLLRLWACPAVAPFKQHGPWKGRLRFAMGPMSLVDVAAIAPFYLQVLVPGLDLRFVRVLRLLRLFRLFRVGRFAESFQTLGNVVRGKREELLISVMVLIIMLILSSSLMYLAEGNAPNTQFTSVPASMWWGMITITTIGYGDMYPVTALGRVLGAVVGFFGVCVFALPVGILGSGFIEEVEKRDKAKAEEAAAVENTEAAPCVTGAALKAGFRFCPHCGEDLKAASEKLGKAEEAAEDTP